MPTQNFDTTYTLPHTNCTEQDFYQLCRTLMPTAGFVDGTTIKRDNVTGQLSAGPFSPIFKKITKTFSDLTYAGLTNDVEILLLPAGGVIHCMKMKHSAAFTGGAISSYTLSVGISALLNKYMVARNCFVAPSNTGFAIVHAPFFNFMNVALTFSAAYAQAELNAFKTAWQNMFAGIIGSEDHANPTSIRLAATSVGGNLSLATAGSVDIWIMYSTLT